MTGTAGPESATTRLSLGSWPTPVEPAPRLGRHLGFEPGMFWFKRDDLTGLGAGGNKVRKLEYLCAAALSPRGDRARDERPGSEQPCTTHRRGRLPPRTRLRPGAGGGAVAHSHREPRPRVHPRRQDRVGRTGRRRRVGRQGGRGRIGGPRPRDESSTSIPLGGSSALGARGYVACGSELEAQVPGVRHVVVALGTGGTMAGLVATLGAERVLGVDVGATTDPRREGGQAARRARSRSGQRRGATDPARPGRGRLRRAHPDGDHGDVGRRQARGRLPRSGLHGQGAERAGRRGSGTGRSGRTSRPSSSTPVAYPGCSVTLY